MADLEEYLFGRGSLYNPKEDPRYSDLTGKQSNYNFAEDWNKSTADYQARELNDQRIQTNEIVLENNKRRKQQEDELIADLANTRTPDEVQDIILNRALKNGDIDMLDKIEQRKRISRKDQMEEIKSLSEIGMEDAAAQKVLEVFGQEVDPQSLRKDPKLFPGADGYYTYDKGGMTKVPNSPGRSQQGGGKIWIYDQSNPNIQPKQLDPRMGMPSGWGVKPLPVLTRQQEMQKDVDKALTQRETDKAITAANKANKGGAVNYSNPIPTPQRPRVAVVRIPGT